MRVRTQEHDLKNGGDNLELFPGPPSKISQRNATEKRVHTQEHHLHVVIRIHTQKHELKIKGGWLEGVVNLAAHVRDTVGYNNLLKRAHTQEHVLEEVNGALPEVVVHTHGHAFAPMLVNSHYYHHSA